MSDNLIVAPVVQTLTVTEVVQSLTVTAPGPQGPQGPQGPSGAQTQVFYTHTQNTPSDTWIIHHNLGGYPTVLVFDSGGAQCEGNISFPDGNTMQVTFSSAFSGTAYII